MTQIRFVPRPRPPPIHTPSSAPLVTRYERSPYPRCISPESAPESPPDSPASTIEAKERIYYLHDEPRPEPFMGKVTHWLNETYSDAKPSAKWTYSFLTVDEHWELVRLDPGTLPHTVSKLIHAYRLYVEFQAGGPSFEVWDDLEVFLRNKCRRECNMPDIIIEFALLDDNRIRSMWYPPNPDKTKLRAFFEGLDPDRSAENNNGDESAVVSTSRAELR
ncbi:hypothetical protein CHU98_g12132 [Xylaria longipes]|nr:hypothetical protein CHU98_g12132 [Xylaria longipes]